MATAKASKKVTLIAGVRSTKVDLSQSISQRITPELVLGFVGPISSGCTAVSDEIIKSMIGVYGYTAIKIRLSEIVEQNADQVGMKRPVPPDQTARIEYLQDVGTKLREKFGAGYLAAKAVEMISIDRGKGGYVDEALKTPKPRRVVHVIDGIKNNQEAEVLRSVYGSAFWLIGVFAPRAVRLARLKSKGHKEPDAIKIMDRDEHEGPKHGQDVREAYYGSDYFLRNPYPSTENLKAPIQRLLAALFQNGILSPTKDERGMAAAKQGAANSSCISRQVGAVIVNSAGSIIGVGWNEVPKSGGGVYAEGDPKDARCFRHGDNSCRNDQQKDHLYTDIISSLAPYLVPGTSDTLIEAALKKTRIKSLIEFSRSVHAEMAALIDAARSSRGGFQGASMYVTTYPCHNCARHIVASGISEVFYIEPFPKSLANELHDDSIFDGAFTTSERGDRVAIEPFQGVGPNRFFSVFIARGERKAAGKVIQVDALQALPAGAESLDAFATLEKRVIENLEAAESKS